MLEYYGLDVFFTWILCLFDCRFGLGGPLWFLDWILVFVVDYDDLFV